MGVDAGRRVAPRKILPYTGVGRVLVAPEFGKDDTAWISISEDGGVLESADMPVASGSNLVSERRAAVVAGVGAAITFR